MERALGKISWFLACTGGAIVFACAILIVADVVLRFFFSVSWLYSFEITTFAFAVAFAMALSDGVVSRANVRIDVVHGKLPVPLKGILNVLTLAVMAGLATGLAYYGIKVAVGSYEIDARSGTTLEVPLVVPQSLWALGLVFFALTSIVVLALAVASLTRRRWKELAEQASIPSEEPEI